MTTKYLLCLGFVHIFDDVDDMWIGFPEAQYIRYSGRRTHAHPKTLFEIWLNA